MSRCYKKCIACLAASERLSSFGCNLTNDCDVTVAVANSFTPFRLWWFSNPQPLDYKSLFEAALTSTHIFQLKRPAVYWSHWTAIKKRFGVAIAKMFLEQKLVQCKLSFWLNVPTLGHTKHWPTISCNANAIPSGRTRRPNQVILGHIVRLWRKCKMQQVFESGKRVTTACLTNEAQRY